MKSIDFKYNGVNDHDCFGPYLFDSLNVRSDGTGNNSVKSLGLMREGTFPVMRSRGGDTPADFVYSLRNVGEGQFVPVMSSIYEITRLERNRVVLKLVEKPERLKDARISPGSIAVPSMDNCTALQINLFYDYGVGDLCQIEIRKIIPAVKSGDKPTAVVIVASTLPAGQRVATPVKREITVAVGDTIPLAHECGFLIRNIVPVDIRQNIIGWVEFVPVGGVGERK